jgi:aspartate carbamoyltransferase regulatory subunit
MLMWPGPDLAVEIAATVPEASVATIRTSRMVRRNRPSAGRTVFAVIKCNSPEAARFPTGATMP